MYSIALAAQSCRRAGTRVDIAWLIDGHGYAADPNDAVALTPGGGRFGGVLRGALDGPLADLVRRGRPTAYIADVEVSPVDATIAGLGSGGRVRCVVAPAEVLPDDLWAALAERRPVALRGDLTGDELDAITVIAVGDDNPAAGTTISPDEGVLTARFVPVDRFVIAGSGSVADAIEAAARLHAWVVQRAGDVATATGLMVGLAAGDAVVVIGHDVEQSGEMLGAALAGDAGYIGALGSRAMQERRAEWLAYRGVTDVSRVHGPAGVAIGARTPAEVAVSILAEVIANRNL